MDMSPKARIEFAIETALETASREGCPPLLRDAVYHAVLPAGSRVRPSLCLAVAHACGDPTPDITDGAAAAIEFLHCASLVHDDLPCFDDADTRRGKPSVHSAYGEPIGVLVGDALIVLAFETLARTMSAKPEKLAAMLPVLSRAVGMSGGLVAGQAWESEPSAPLSAYQSAKTGALFVAATKAGAVSAGHDPARWEEFGARLGEAYQVADDFRDVFSTAADIGKPVHQDQTRGRPNAVRQFGRGGAIQHLEALVGRAIAAIPECRGAADLQQLVRMQVRKIMPKDIELAA